MVHLNQSTNSQQRTSSTNESGLVRSWANSGFTIAKCISELFVNAIDAKTQGIGIRISRDTIKVIDDGKTLTLEKLSEMPILYSENHASTPDMGRSGIGFKAAAYNLSKCKGIPPKKNKTFVTGFCSDVDKYYNFFFDWNKIQKFLDSNDPYAWTDAIAHSIIPVELTDQEKYNFIDDRKTFGFSSGGVTITVPFSDDLYKNIKNQFDSPCEIYQSSERLDHILGSTNNLHISLRDELDDFTSLLKPMILYNPFNQPRNHYSRYVEYDIAFSSKLDGYWYAVPRSTSKHPSTCFLFSTPKKVSLNTKRGGLINTEDLRNEEKEDFSLRMKITLPVFTDSDYLNSGVYLTLTKYEADNKFFDANAGEDEISNRVAMSFERNGQFIGKIPLHSPGNFRQQSCNFRSFRVRSILKYTTLSKQENQMDADLCVQICKNQFIAENFPSKLKNLLKLLHNEQAKEWKAELEENSQLKPQKSKKIKRRGKKKKSKNTPAHESDEDAPSPQPPERSGHTPEKSRQEINNVQPTLSLNDSPVQKDTTISPTPSPSSPKLSVDEREEKKDLYLVNLKQIHEDANKINSLMGKIRQSLQTVENEERWIMEQKNVQFQKLVVEWPNTFSTFMNDQN